MGIMHRDIKPENLLLADATQGLTSIKVADFGLARQFESDNILEHLASTTCGTPGYVCPEVLEGKKYGIECDYWSIGCVSFVVLSGTMPFWSDDNYRLYEKIRKGKWEFESKAWVHVSDQAKDFVTKILVKDPSQRMNCDQMMDHPWMTTALGDTPLVQNKEALG